MAKYTTEQKEAVINRAREIGAVAAAKATGTSGSGNPVYS
jgi:hypothetical protein